MTKTFRIYKTVLTAVFLILGSLSPYAKRVTHNTNSMTPDFAFPKRVVEEAQFKLDQALNNQNDVAILRSAMDLSIGSMLISHENVRESLNLLDSIAPSLKAPYKAIDYLIQANIYNDIYNSDPYGFNNRTVDAELAQESPLFWDRALFKEKVISLVDFALAEKKEASKVPLSSIDALITESALNTDFTIYDFIVYQAIKLLIDFESDGVIPFNKKDAEGIDRPIELINSLISLHPNPSKARISALMTKAQLMTPQESAEFLWQEIQAMKKSPEVRDLVISFYNNFRPSLEKETKRKPSSEPFVISAEEFYSFMVSLKENLKQKTSDAWIDEILCEITRPTVQIHYPSEVVPDVEFEANVDAENIQDFYVLLIKTEGKMVRDTDIAHLNKNSKVIDAQKVSLNKTIPFKERVLLKFKVNSPGTYSLIASTTPKCTDIITTSKNLYITTFEASSIDIFSSCQLASETDQDNAEKNFGCYVVNSQDGSPIEKAEVKFVNHGNGYYDDNKNKSVTKETDASGFVPAAYDNADAQATYQGSKASTSIYKSHLPKAETRKSIKLFTDQQIYRPGDKVNFFGIYYEVDPKKNEGRLLKNEPVDIRIYNSNMEVVDTISCRSDNSGRIFADFQLPNDGLLGTWYLDSENEWQNFEVAAYKVPNIFVSLCKTESAPDSISFEGLVSTFSGMPVQDTKVTFNVNFSPYYYMWFGRIYEQSEYSSSVVTDGLGKFKITLPTSNLKPSEYRGLFTITASATDEGGETATSPAVAFWIVNSYQLRANIPGKICVTDTKIDFKVEVLDGAGLPAVKPVGYTVSNEKGDTILKGEFNSPLLSIDSSLLPSGRYNFDFNIIDEEYSDLSASTIIYRKTDTKAPIETVLWLPETKYTIPANIAEFEVPFGSSYPGQHVLCTVSNSSGKVKSFWIKADGEMQKVKVSSPDSKENTYVTFTALREHIYTNETVTLVPQVQTEKLEIITESFRNALTPGDQEEWKFTLKLGGKPERGYLYALLYDKAMDAIADLQWNPFLFSSTYYKPISFRGESLHALNQNFTDRMCHYPSVDRFSFNFLTYGYGFYEEQVYYRMTRATSAAAPHSKSVMKMNAAKMDYPDDLYIADDSAMSNGIAMDDYALAEGGAEEAAIEEETEASSDSSREFRPIEMPVAFFKPNLTTDKKGEVSVKFTVPNFNTTWKFVMGAYTPELNSDMIRLEAVASKKVMVSMNPPRFLRTGDDAVITATVYNNSEEKTLINVDFEIFNPLTNEILKKETANSLSVDPSGSKVVSIQFKCPDNLSMVGLRIYASGNNHKDGEQTLIPVLPSSQPVIESDPFYIPAAEKDFTYKLPQIKGNASVTFSYCDNPVWEAVRALPSIIQPNSESLTSLIQALYANCAGRGIMTSNPSIEEGLKLILSGEAGDSMLVSNLSKDQELKALTLKNTPWVNNAKNETLRLSKLGSLLDKADADKAILETWNKICALRNPDGGWSWCQGMRSSSWITEAVLINLGLLKTAGYLPNLNNLDSYVNTAIKFVESEYAADYAKIKGTKDYFYRNLLQYLYIRSFFPDVKSSTAFTEIKNKAVNYIAANWKEEPIFYKATAAIMLWRNGKQSLAKEILESLSQFTSQSREKGVWFDNLDSDWRGAGKMLTTARVLMAFNEIEPKNELIDGMRQWMLIQRQAQDWQEGLWSIDAIDALLSTGSKWTGNYDEPSITICGQKIDFDKIANLTGQIKVNLNGLKLEGNDIKIHRNSPSPAWGGVISQYIAPMDEVKADSIEDLKINKEYWVINETEEGVKAVKSSSLKVGDKVRVSLIVDCGRDMDFVAINDERAACLEPADQLSGYTVIDGLWCYRETRNNSTNLFFNFLPRGRHIISYECRIMEEGEFSSGIASIQCMYSPLLTAHSAGEIINCK